jgi:hypothetical protein
MFSFICGGGGRGKEKDREWVIPKYIVSGCEDGITKHTAKC